MSRFDTTAIAKGAGIAGVIALVCGVVQRALPNSGGALSGLLFLLILAAMAFGGYVAGSPQPRVALTAGALAGLIADAVLQVVNVVAAIIRGTLSVGTIASVVLVVLICTSAASLGGYVAFRRTADQGVER